MTTNPKESQPNPPESQGIPPAAPETAAEPAAVLNPDPGAEVEITVDHVYLPLDEDGNGRADWAVTSDSTSRVSQGTCLKVPTDLALHLDKRKQAKIL
jgi:hypothetical protein